ncbi:MAG: FHA domain-containing protein [Anaerolineales bacterium]|nr:FHA domain-containing protein [Anaerolineales bacterium]MCB9143990.1 FHA domain-containing protein [Anaerolineales bacterium]
MSAIIVLALRIMAALALYGFLGWAFYYLYQEVKRQGANIANKRIPGITLMIKPKDGKPSLRYFNQTEITIGRDPGCDVPLSEDTISARHAHLVYHHNQWWLEDLSSTNGTRLNNTFITIPTVVTTDDDIQCGGYVMSINLSENVIIEPTQRLKKKPAQINEDDD